MSNIATKLTYLNETKSKIKDNINLTGANITNEDTFRSYSDKLKQGLLDVLNNGNDYLYNNFPQLNDEGQNMSLTPTLEAPIKSELQGNTSQNGTPTPDAPVEVINATGRQVVKVVGKNLFDKDSVVSGFVNADGTVGGDTNAYRTSDFIPIQPNTAYYKTNTASPRTKYFDSNKQPLNTTAYQDISIGGSAGTFTTPNNAYYLRFSYPIASVDADSIQIEKGTSFTEYKEYKEQSYEINLGKNLFDKSNITTGKTYTGTGDITTLNNSFVQETYIPVSSSTAYTMSTTNNYSSETDYRLVICEYKDDKTFIKRNLGGSAVGNKYTITTTENTKYVRLCASTITLDELQFEKGQATSYAPYITPIELCKIGNYQDSIRKGTGKNLFDAKNKIRSSYNTNGITFTNNGDGTFNISGTATSNTNINVALGITDVFEVGETYSLYSSQPYNGITFNYSVALKGSGSYYYLTPNSSQTINETLTVANLTIYISNGTTINAQNVSTMIYKGSTPTDYEPYGSKGKWLLTKKIGKVVLDGSNDEFWSRSDATTETSFVGALNLQITGLITKFNTGDYWFCDKFTYGSLGVDYRFKLYNGDASAGYTFLGLTIPTSLASDINTFRIWLGNNNVTLYYVLNTPTTTEITDSTLLNDLNNLEDAKSYNGTTNIIITGETPADLKITVLKNE